MNDIERDIFKKENRREVYWDDDIVVVFYDGKEVIKGSLSSLKESYLHTDSIVYSPDEYQKCPYLYNVFQRMRWSSETKSYKYGMWDIIILDI